MTNNRVVICISAFLSLLMQVFLAPHIAIGFALPNFIVAFCLAIVIVQQGTGGFILAFVMGLLYDLLSGGPVGGMAFSLTLVVAFASAMFRRANNDTLFITIAVLAGAVLLTEVIYGMLFLLFGYAMSLADALVFRVVPCFLYDFVIAFVFFFVLTRLVGTRTPLRSEIKQL